MPVSGNIGDTIQFQVTGAISVTGVKFGGGQANFNKISDTVLDTIIPQTATYGKVAFQKENSVETFDITATGDGNDGAYGALSGVINTSGFFGAALSGCTTGDVTFSDYNTAFALSPQQGALRLKLLVSWLAVTQAVTAEARQGSPREAIQFQKPDSEA